MAIIKCKMCGGELRLIEGASTAECEYCGSVQTVPKVDDEKKLTLFARANRLRAACEFDKAAGIYESIVADFPEEAEAYWGLVLCKYGIEYVDDPATGKKIPTCHRSSFDTLMEDGDFEQAMENADAVARKVYRDEAKQIEEIRKGILAVSNNEQPYDIFICYKETDENGQRTLDSVLAQDIYDTLTDKGYRVFFSRITLEDKLGMEYEPYIFAALNSAKIMLAFGTDYEYFNAVWVKNEWSRYLKLMATDKSKHLIPCYKGIDAYDMPKEFAKLQAQDLGKLGATQDLLRGIEKLLPKKNNTVVIQEKVVVGGGGDNKIASLLDRGNMALEDGDWAKADSFFEDVLNNDSKNAQAYLGKALAQEKCRTLDAFVHKRKEFSNAAKAEQKYIPVKSEHIAQMVAQYSIPGYVSKTAIDSLYAFDLSYSSEAASRRQQYSAEQSYWTNHKLLSRAEQFATGAVAENLAAEKKALFAALSNRVKKAEEAEAAAKAQVQQAYDAHIAQADEQAALRHEDGIKRKALHYQNLVHIAKESKYEWKLAETAKAFDALGDYQDSKQMAEYCRMRIAEAQAKIAAEKACREESLRQEAAQKARRTKKIMAFSIATVCIAVTVILLLTMVFIPNSKYKKALALLESGQYLEAKSVFEALAGYKDSEAKIKEIWDHIAVRETISAGTYHTIGLLTDGTVVTVGSTDNNKCDVSDWADIIAISSQGNYTIGLRTDGTVVAVGANNRSQCDVSGWSNIVAISAGFQHTVGLKADGTVVATGHNFNGQCDVSDWTDIVAISVGYAHTVGLKADGTVVAVGYNDSEQCNISGWTDILAISAGGYHTVGLKADGTVVAVGANGEGQCNVSGWTDIVAISAGSNRTMGLKADGTVVAVGNNDYGQCNVSDWTNIKTP